MYHWTQADRDAFKTETISTMIKGSAKRLSQLLCDVRVVVQPDCPEAYATVHLEFVTTGAFQDVYYDAHTMLDANDAAGRLHL